MAIVLHCEAHWMLLGGQWGYIPANPLHAENLLSRDELTQRVKYLLCKHEDPQYIKHVT